MAQNTINNHIGGSALTTGYTFPLSDGSANQILQSNAAGTGFWGAATKVWTAYTCNITGSTTNPTQGTGAVKNAYYLQVGKILFLAFWYTQGASPGTAGSGTYLFSLPTGYSIDSTIITSGSYLFQLGASACYLSSDNGGGNTFPVSSTTISLNISSSAGGAANFVVGSSFFGLNNTNLYITFNAAIPIV